MSTTPTGRNRHELLAKRRRYRRLMIGSIAVGVALSLLLRALDYPLVGEVVYWVGIVGFVAVWLATPVTLFDERDVALERRAAHLTLNAFAPVLVIGASAARILTHVGAYEVPATVWGALWGYFALFVTFGVAYGWLRYRP
jgi:tellurite resistance protein TehA-like permease